MIHEGKLNGVLNRSSCQPGFRLPPLFLPLLLFFFLQLGSIFRNRLPEHRSIMPPVCLPVLSSLRAPLTSPNFRRCIPTVHDEPRRPSLTCCEEASHGSLKIPCWRKLEKVGLRTLTIISLYSFFFSFLFFFPLDFNEDEFNA